MMTGQGAARHGRFAGVHFASGTYGQVADPMLVESFWDALDPAGLRSATVDVRFARPGPIERTTMLVEWDASTAPMGCQVGLRKTPRPSERGDDINGAEPNASGRVFLCFNLPSRLSWTPQWSR